MNCKRAGDVFWPVELGVPWLFTPTPPGACGHPQHAQPCTTCLPALSSGLLFNITSTFGCITVQWCYWDLRTFYPLFVKACAVTKPVPFPYFCNSFRLSTLARFIYLFIFTLSHGLFNCTVRSSIKLPSAKDRQSYYPHVLTWYCVRSVACFHCFHFLLKLYLFHVCLRFSILLLPWFYYSRHRFWNCTMETVFIRGKE